jgi:hypothetical protein
MSSPVCVKGGNYSTGIHKSVRAVHEETGRTTSGHVLEKAAGAIEGFDRGVDVSGVALHPILEFLGNVGIGLTAGIIMELLKADFTLSEEDEKFWRDYCKRNPDVWWCKRIT